MLLVQQCYSPCLYSYPQSLQLYNSYRINRDHVVLKTVFGLELWFMGRSMRYYWSVYGKTREWRQPPSVRGDWMSRTGMAPECFQRVYTLSETLGTPVYLCTSISLGKESNGSIRLSNKVYPHPHKRKRLVHTILKYHRY